MRVVLSALAQKLAFGPHQFAYTPERGARDALANLVLVWITGLLEGLKIAVYCSDVSGAFDRVKADRLVYKLRAKQVHPLMVEVLKAWLRSRRATVVVGGKSST